MLEAMSHVPVWLVTTIGFVAQFFFSSRIIVQWFASEKTKKLESPTMYWVLSVLGSYTFLVYGALRCDFSIILGQFVSYYIYLWNLNLKGLWQRISKVGKGVLIITPVIIGALFANQADAFVSKFFQNEDRPLWLIIYGSFFQLVFSLRFLYQWYRSYKKGESVMPTSFWVLSLVGACGIFSYAIILKGLDIVLIVGQGFGILAYTRNIMIGAKARKNAQLN